MPDLFGSSYMYICISARYASEHVKFGNIGLF